MFSAHHTSLYSRLFGAGRTRPTTRREAGRDRSRSFSAQTSVRHAMVKDALRNGQSLREVEDLFDWLDMNCGQK